MPSVSTRRRRSRTTTVSQALAAGRLRTRGVVVFMLGAAAQLTVIAGVVAIAYAQTGQIGIPAVFLAVGAVLLLFSVGYVAMGQQIAKPANTGALYAYIRYLGRPWGVAAGWLALVAYTPLQVGLYGIIGAAASPLLSQWFGVDLEWWRIALVAWLLVLVLGLLQLDLAANVLGVLLAAEIGYIVVFGGASASSPAGGHLSFETLSPANLSMGGFGPLVVVAVLGFIGFEMGVVFAVSAADPKTTVKRATYAAVVVLAVLYAGAAWAMAVDVGVDRIVAVAGEQQQELLFSLVGSHLGAIWVDIGHAVFVTSAVAALASFHNLIARYAHAMANQGVLPFPLLAKVSARTNAPWAASLAQSVCGLVVILTYAIYSWDPVVQLFYWGGVAGGLGVLFLIIAASVAVVVFMARQTEDRNVWRRFIAPAISCALLLGIGWLAIRDLPTLFGVKPDHPLVRVVLGVYLSAIVIGLLRAWVLRVTKPEVYWQIGSDSAAIETTL